ncbi:DUF6238 family protein [Streptomyces sp. CMB-StM0423]|uniref:DUF6238 family protein n=1 Tax=Streptomyces sp. CMB-StM0423 TaxID=2059884 RepID=UPI000C7053F3|nr:DUF6238 family protein [Streptomyces sp. CMB-StM0423]AUH40517.1 hypothetical protein CXR04_09875 [Streptomyces sp. CMB-StM0423]
MTLRPPPDDAYPYLRAASAGIRHHTRAQKHTDPAPPAGRPHLDVLHAHLTTVHQLLDHLAETTRPGHPAAGRRLAAAHTRLWQAAAELHDAFHLLPSHTAADDTEARTCRPERLPEGPPVLTICQRHLAAGHSIRRKTTPADHRQPRTTSCTR